MPQQWGFGLPVVYLAWLLVVATLYPAPLVRCSEAASRRLVAVLSVEPYALAAASRERGSAAVTTVNHQFRLAARPVGLPKSSDWNYTEEPVRAPNDGEVLVKIAYLSLDPAMRGWMNDVKSIHPAGADRRGDARRRRRRSARVATSGIQEGRPCVRHRRHPGIRDRRRQRSDKSRHAARAAPVYLGTLGMPGMTAYFGLLDVGKPQPGQTVVVSAQPARSAWWSGRSRRSKDVARSASPAAARSATTSCASSASTPQSTTSRTT